MELTLTSAQRSFRDEVRAWLAANVPRPPLPAPGTDEGFAAHRAWERELFAAGYAALRWPEELGGRGADAVTQAIFEEEYVLSDAPERVTVVGHNLMGPTLMVHGDEGQKRRWLPRILAAEDIWVQGYSEPEAGSDLAAVRTRAVRDGDEFVVDGQKIWTSWGPYGDWIFTLVRTDPRPLQDRVRPPRSRRVSASWRSTCGRRVSRSGRSPAPTVTRVAEVFFTGVRVPADQLVGALNDGWRVAATALEDDVTLPRRRRRGTAARSTSWSASHGSGGSRATPSSATASPTSTSASRPTAPGPTDPRGAAGR